MWESKHTESLLCFCTLTLGPTPLGMLSPVKGWRESWEPPEGLFLHQSSPVPVPPIPHSHRLLWKDCQPSLLKDHGRNSD